MIVTNALDYRGFKIEIMPDPDPLSPREDRDCNLGTIYYAKESHYVLGDEALDPRQRDELCKSIHGDDYITLPVYAYIHGGVVLNTTGFSCGWDSGQSGWITVSKEKVRAWFGANRISPKLLERVKRILCDEVETYSKFLSGSVYGYRVVRDLGCIHCKEMKREELDGCWGYYDEEDAINEAKGYVDNYLLGEGFKKPGEAA